jgi:uncharacterized membrane protein
VRVSSRIPLILAGVLGLLILLASLDDGLASVIRPSLAVPFTLLLPGFALSAALWPSGLGTAERAALSLGLSLALLALAAFALNLTPVGLTSVAWVALIGTISLAGLVAAALRTRHAGSSSQSRGLVLRGPGWHGGAMLAIAALVVFAAVCVAHFGAVLQPRPGFTMLWLLPDADNGDRTVRVGITNEEQVRTRYMLQLVADGKQVQSWPELALDAGQSWQVIARLPPASSGTATIEALLYRLDRPGEVYRRVQLRPSDQARGKPAPAG